MQGGAIFTLVDLAGAAAANSHGTQAVSISSSISYFKATSKGVLFAEAVEESLTHKLGTYTIRVTNQEGELIALSQGTYYHKKYQQD